MANKSAGPGLNQKLDLTIEKLVPGGDGMSHAEGKVIFVPGTLPGEKVRVRCTESKKDYARGDVVEILEASPDRVKPPCPVFGRCGGCDWQHAGYEAQLRLKVAMVEDALRRTGGLAFPGLAIESGKPLRYRNRIQTHRDSSGRAGFLARNSHAVVPVDTCPISHPAFDALLAGPRPRGGVRGGGPDPDAIPTFREDRQGPGRRYAAWAHTPRGGAGDYLVGEGPDGTTRLGAASKRLPAEPIGEISVEVLGKTVRFDLRCFFQSNLEMLEKLIPYALEGLGGREAMDLYGGVGLFGAFLADHFETVVSVEENPIALEYALRNIGEAHRFLRGRLEDLVGEVRGHLADSRPEAIVVDPPRDGLDATVKDFLVAKMPARLIYVSCNPVTLARDLKILLARGFRLDDLRLFDFYPQTAHVEAVAKLSPV